MSAEIPNPDPSDSAQQHPPASNPMPSLNNLDTFNMSNPSQSLPLLVLMPDGERRQVDVSPAATVKDLKSSIADWLPDSSEAAAQPWQLDFGGETLNENQTLGDYNIPDTYDHANGLLKTISDSAHLNPDKKVEALDKAVAVVKGISRGERDMERLINAVFDDTDDTLDTSPSQQPALSATRRARPSRIPSLNFSHLPPLAPTSTQKIPFNSVAPPTPTQLIRKLSVTRPDLYAPSIVNKTVAPRATEQRPALPAPSKRAAAEPSKPPASQPPPPQQPAPQPPAQGSGELKRGNTWFTDVISAFGNSIPPTSQEQQSGEASSDGYSDVGNSEDETPAARSQSSTLPNRNASNQTNSSSPSAEHKNDSNQSMHKTEPQLPSTTPSNLQTSISTQASTPVATTEPSQKASAQAAPDASANPTSQPQRQVIGLEPEISLEENIKRPKKRGRKRKNPHLSEEERKAQRQAQNRESAKLSRIRRKNMTAEYEKRVSTLEGENENLRDTVNALNDRLEMLQKLLTISVQRRPMSEQIPPMPKLSAPITSAATQQQFLPAMNQPTAPAVNQPMNMNAAAVNPAISKGANLGYKHF